MQFAGFLPASFKANAKRINDRGGWEMPEDNNTFRKIFKRLTSQTSFKSWLNESFNSGVNMIATFTVNFQVIFYNYFGPIVVIIL